MKETSEQDGSSFIYTDCPGCKRTVFKALLLGKL